MSSVLNAIRVLEEVAKAQPIGVGELSRTLDMPKTSVQRALVSLGEAGWLRKLDDGSRRWMLTARLALVARRSKIDALRSAAAPAMERLRREEAETVLLVALEGDSLVVVESLEGTGPVRAHLSVGATLPLHASASGKAILATLPEPDLQRILRHQLEKFTPATITDADVLRREVRATAKRGYSIYSGEWLADLASVGVPIGPADDGARAALVIVAPVTSMPRARQHQLGKALLVAKKQVETALGL